MNPETETASPAAGSNGMDSSDATITHVSETSKSSSINGRQGRGRGGLTIRGGNQGRGVHVETPVPPVVSISLNTL